MSRQPRSVPVTSTVALDAEISTVAPSAAGDAVICGTADGRVLVWKPGETAPPVAAATLGSRVLAVAQEKDGRIFAIATNGALFAGVTAGTPSMKPMALDAGKGPLRVAAFTSDRRLLAIGNEFGEIRIITVADGAMERTIAAHRTELHDMRFRPGSNLLASASAEGDLRIWEASTGRRVWGMDPDLALLALAFNPVDGTLASGGVGRRLVWHDRTTWEPFASAALQRPRIVATLAWSPDGRRLAVGDIDDESLSKGSIEIREAATRAVATTLDTGGKPAAALTFVAPTTLVGAFNRELRAWSGLVRVG